MKRLDRLDFLASAAHARTGWVLLLGVAVVATCWPLLQG